MPPAVVLVTTSPRLPARLLSRAGWAAVGTATTAYADRPGWELPLLTGEPAAVASELLEGDGPIVYVGASSDALTDTLRAAGAEVEVVAGSWDPPGARLLDVVAVMDRLRSPGGCPWDAEQTHDSLRPYLLEEVYEAYDALVDGDLPALREELGDVLLQVAFHARLAEEADPPWSIDDVAEGLVDKLVRRHPHVFAATAVSGAGEVATNWEQIKRAEKGRTSVTDGIARSQPALALAQALVRRAAAAALPAPEPGADLGARLLALAAEAHTTGRDAEAALRAAADTYAATLRATEKPAPHSGDQEVSRSEMPGHARSRHGESS